MDRREENALNEVDRIALAVELQFAVDQQLAPDTRFQLPWSGGVIDDHVTHATCELALAGKHGSYALAPGFFDRRQDAEFVIHQDIVARRIAPFHVFQRLFLVDIDEH